MEIYKQKNGDTTRADLVEIGNMLVKAGYTVRRTKRKIRAEDKYSTEMIEFYGDADTAKI